MNHEEALLKKKEIIAESNGKLKDDNVIIAPYEMSEYDAFIEFYKREKYNDDLCKSFSSDGKFNVYLVF